MVGDAIAAAAAAAVVPKEFKEKLEDRHAVSMYYVEVV